MWDQNRGQFYPTPQPGIRPGGELEKHSISEPDTMDAWQPLLEDLPPGADVTSPQWHRAHTRQLLREFLRAVPRSEPEATLALVRQDGSTRVFTRAELSTAIDRLRPRMRQILRLALEERWSRQRVCDYLKGISIKTFERDQVEGLDILAQL